MNTFDRRKFLKSVLCGAGLMIVGSRPLSLLANPPAKKNPAELSDSALLLKQFEEARTLFHKKQFAESELLYKSMLAGLPAHISIYDCYKNLLSWQNRTDEVIPYLKQAIARYPGRADFYDRLAKTYREIATGNKKIEKRVCQAENQADLIEVALGWYDRAIERSPDKKFLYFGMLDTLCAVAVKNSTPAAGKGRSALAADGLPQMDGRQQQLTAPYIREWLARKNPPQRENAGKARVIATVPVQTRIKIEKIMKKERRTLYDPFEIESRAREIKLVVKKLNTELHAFYVREKKYAELTALAAEMLRDNPEESQVLGITRKVLQKAGRGDLELQLYNERSKHFNDFWTRAGWAKAHLHGGAVGTAQASFEKLSDSVALRMGEKVDLIHRGLCDCAVAQGNYSAGREYLSKGIELTGGIGGIATSLLLRYAECLCLENNPGRAVALLRKRLYPNDAPELSDPVLKYIAPDMGTSTELYYLHQFYSRQKKVHAQEKASLWCAIAKIQRQTGDRSGLDQSCREIEALIPGHPFVKKIKSAI